MQGLDLVIGLTQVGNAPLSLKFWAKLSKIWAEIFVVLGDLRTVFGLQHEQILIILECYRESFGYNFAFTIVVWQTTEVT